METPYWRRASTIAKGHWFGRTRGEVLSEIKGARVVPPHLNSDVVREHDVLEYEVHVHEPPVPELEKIQVIYSSDKYVVINKPSGVPTHPTVNYFHNTATEYLQRKYNYGNLYPGYRLDRLTSGVLIFLRSPEALQEFLAETRSKVYYAKVRPVPAWDLHRVVPLRDPVVTYNAKRGFDAFLKSYAKAKPAETLVSVVSRELGIIKCVPVTGRTHQIRKALALVGSPIHNDPIYNDGGRFARLCKDPSQQNFDAVYEHYDVARKAKLTGEYCDECGQELYHHHADELDLHCAAYTVGSTTFTASASWIPASLLSGTDGRVDSGPTQEAR